VLKAYRIFACTGGAGCKGTCGGKVHDDSQVAAEMNQQVGDKALA